MGESPRAHSLDDERRLGTESSSVESTCRALCQQGGEVCLYVCSPDIYRGGGHQPVGSTSTIMAAGDGIITKLGSRRSQWCAQVGRGHGSLSSLPFPCAAKMTCSKPAYSVKSTPASHTIVTGPGQLRSGRSVVVGPPKVDPRGRNTAR